MDQGQSQQPGGNGREVRAEDSGYKGKPGYEDVQEWYDNDFIEYVYDEFAPKFKEHFVNRDESQMIAVIRDAIDYSNNVIKAFNLPDKGAMEHYMRNAHSNIIMKVNGLVSSKDPQEEIDLIQRVSKASTTYSNEIVIRVLNSQD